MIKLFRKIRGKMLTENKFSKYLLYAFGEILLVVIGILLALQINSWNQQRMEDKKEVELLYGLKDEFHYNLITLAESIKGNKKVTEYCVNLTLLI
ncbi:MAG: hypothetical protein ACI9EV_002583, partial [Urechidicola sp.]